MAKYLLDTNILINHARGKIDLSKSCDLSNSYISFVSAAELIVGARNKKELNKIQKFISTFNVDYAEPQVLVRALSIFAKKYLANGCEFLDAILAASALEDKVILVTNNIKHFKKINRLKLMSENEYLAG